MKPTRVILVEDQRIIAEAACEMLTHLGYEVVACAHDFDQAAHCLRTVECEILITDINLGKGDEGIELGKIMRDEIRKPFIYLTGHSDRVTVTKAKETYPSAYLVKPFSDEDLFAAIEISMAKRPEATNQTMILRDGHVDYKVPHSDILFVKADNIYLEVHTSKRKFIIRETLENFLKEAGDNNFVRTHRSWVVNLNHVEAVNSRYLVVAAFQIPVARSQMDEVVKRFKA